MSSAFDGSAKLFQIGVKPLDEADRPNNHTALDRPGGTVFVIQELVVAGPA